MPQILYDVRYVQGKFVMHTASTIGASFMIKKLWVCLDSPIPEPSVRITNQICIWRLYLSTPDSWMTRDSLYRFGILLGKRGESLSLTVLCKHLLKKRCDAVTRRHHLRHASLHWVSFKLCLPENPFDASFTDSDLWDRCIIEARRQP